MERHFNKSSHGGADLKPSSRGIYYTGNGGPWETCHDSYHICAKGCVSEDGIYTNAYNSIYGSNRIPEKEGLKLMTMMHPGKN